MTITQQSIYSRFGSIKARPPLASAGQRIGLLGGSFNPPHDGHRLITQIALKRLQLDRIWWLVTPGNPLKSHDDLPPLNERMEACRDFIRNPRVVVTGFEAQLATAYTVATLDYLQARRPGVHFVWIMGADNLATFHHWRQWREIADLMPIAVVDRPGWHLKALASPAAQALQGYWLPESKAANLAPSPAPRISFLTGPLSLLSSTALRAKENT